MRFVWAVVAFVLAAGLIGVGIAQRTVFLGPSEQTVAIEAEEATPFVMLDDDVFTALPEALPGESGTLEVQGESVFAAYGRTHDVEAWLSDQTYTRVGASDDAEQVLESETVEPQVAAEDGAEAEGRSPVGSDLWLEEFAAEGSLERQFSFPEGGDMSVLLATDGTAPAPTEISVTWPIDNSTPAAPWLIGGGIALLVVGLVLWILGIRHSRRSRGPRRKGLPVPATEPIDVSEREIEAGERKGVITSGQRRKSIGPRRRGLIAVPAAGLTLALLAGCAPDAAPAPTPTPTETVVAPENQQKPALTDAQAARIVADISETVAAADEANDEEVAAQRLDGLALQMRSVNYRIRSQFADYASLPPIPAEGVQILLPQAFDEWPRSALVVVSDEQDETVPPTILTMTQADPWSPYKASYIASLEPAAEIPDLAPSYQGSALVPPDSSFLAMAPDDVAAAYADILGSGDESAYADAFDAETDTFRAEVKRVRDETAAELTSQEVAAEISFDQGVADAEPLALATLHSGAIVAVGVTRSEKVTSTDSLGVVRHGGDPALEALTGETETAGSFVRTDTSPLFFYVPAQGSEEKIRLLGWASAVTDGRVEEPQNTQEEG